MGYSDLGCFGAEISTPNIDRLAKNGIKFSNMNNAAVCTHSRASFLTGNWWTSGIDNAKTLPTYLKTAGYATGMVGKGHIFGVDQNGVYPANLGPIQRGFEYFYGFLGGDANYFTGGDDFKETINGVLQNTTLDKYSTDKFTDKAITYIDQKAPSADPFFLYLSYQAPHSPLQVPAGDIAKYRGKYLKGWKAIRDARFQNQQKFGLIKAGTINAPYPTDLPNWDNLTPQQRDLEDYRMAVYAAMISRIDSGIGRITDKLKSASINELNNTLIIFLSDNGANSGFQGTLENNNLNAGKLPGAADATWYAGQGWAYTSVTPFRLYKNTQNSGGVKTGVIAHWPNVINPTVTIPANPNGLINSSQLHIVDILPTLIDIGDANVARRNNIKADVDGKSFSQMLNTEVTTVRGSAMYDYLYDDRSIRTQNWTLVEHDHPQNGPNNWELYASDDLSEINNVATSNPNIVTSLANQWIAWYNKPVPFNPTENKQADVLYAPLAMRLNLGGKFGYAQVVGTDHLNATQALLGSNLGLPNRPAATVIRNDGIQYDGQEQGNTKGYPVATDLSGNISHRLVLKDKIPSRTRLEVFSMPVGESFIFEYPNVPQNIKVFEGDGVGFVGGNNYSAIPLATSLTNLRNTNETRWFWKDNTAYVKYKLPAGTVFNSTTAMKNVFLCLDGNCANGADSPPIVADFNRLDSRGVVKKPSGNNPPNFDAANNGSNTYTVTNTDVANGGVVDFNLTFDGKQNWEDIANISVQFTDSPSGVLFIKYGDNFIEPLPFGGGSNTYLSSKGQTNVYRKFNIPVSIKNKEVIGLTFRTRQTDILSSTETIKINEIRLGPPPAEGGLPTLSQDLLTTNLNDYENIAKKEFLVYPNPSKGLFNLSLSGNWKVFSVGSTKEVKAGFGNKIDLTGFAKGIYIIKMNNGYQKVVIE